MMGDICFGYKSTTTTTTVSNTAAADIKDISEGCEATLDSPLKSFCLIRLCSSWCIASQQTFSPESCCGHSFLTILQFRQASHWPLSLEADRFCLQDHSPHIVSKRAVLPRSQTHVVDQSPEDHLLRLSDISEYIINTVTCMLYRIRETSLFLLMCSEEDCPAYF